MKNLKCLTVLTASCIMASSVGSLAASVSQKNQNNLTNLFQVIIAGKDDSNNAPANYKSNFGPRKQNVAPKVVQPVQSAAQQPPVAEQPAKDFNKNFDLVDKGVKNKIGQMIMVGFRGTSSKDAGVKAVMRELAEGSIGGVMLMKHNVVSIRQIARLTKALRKAAKSGGQLPPLISVDQEGGLVQRLRFTNFPSALKISRTSERNAANVYRKMACELRSTGINVNFGPVVDLDVNGKANPIIGRLGRSYGKSPKTVVKFANQFIAAHKRVGIMTTAKHFPGHGSSLTDSHKGFTAIPKWSRTELIPFQKLASGGANKAVDMVMVGHLYNKLWGAPASLSNKAISRLLRKDVKFKGLVITDDMEMGAIRKNYGWFEAISLAVKAGNDILLYSNTAKYQPYLGRKIRDRIARSICKGGKKSGCIAPAIVDTAFRRIAKSKGRTSRMAAYGKPNRCSVFAQK